MLPYEFLLEQNLMSFTKTQRLVLLPYEFLLEQNLFDARLDQESVLLPYEFLLERTAEHSTFVKVGFVT